MVQQEYPGDYFKKLNYSNVPQYQPLLEPNGTTPADNSLPFYVTVLGIFSILVFGGIVIAYLAKR